MVIENYKSTQTNRFYPGRISEERQRALADFEISIDELGKSMPAFARIAEAVGRSIDSGDSEDL